MTRHHRTGHALIGTTVFVMLSSIMATTVLTQIGAAVRSETASQTRLDYVSPSAYAVAWRLGLLETGEPPTTTYECRAEVLPEVFYVLRFERTRRRPLKYELSVRPVTARDGDLPLAPGTFGANTNDDERQQWLESQLLWESRSTRYDRRP